MSFEITVFDNSYLLYVLYVYAHDLLTYWGNSCAAKMSQRFSDMTTKTRAQQLLYVSWQCARLSHMLRQLVRRWNESRVGLCTIFSGMATKTRAKLTISVMSMRTTFSRTDATRAQTPICLICVCARLSHRLRQLVRRRLFSRSSTRHSLCIFGAKLHWSENKRCRTARTYAYSVLLHMRYYDWYIGGF